MRVTRKPRRTPLERFYTFVYLPQLECLQEDCWLWIGGTVKGGYGRFRLDGRMALAHRAAWELFKGSIPEGMFVLHNCPAGDNAACVNPSHLWLGTQQDNIADMVKKGRQSRGLSHRLLKKPRTAAIQSGYRGVSWSKHDYKWRAQIWINGKPIILGRFSDPAEASVVYQSALANL